MSGEGGISLAASDGARAAMLDLLAYMTVTATMLEVALQRYLCDLRINSAATVLHAEHPRQLDEERAGPVDNRRLNRRQRARALCIASYSRPPAVGPEGIGTHVAHAQ